MSLLLDALKRAEQEKQARQGERAGAAATTGAAPRPTLELAPIAPAEAPSPARAAGSAAAAPAVAPKSAPTPSRRTGLWIAAGAIVVAVLAGGGYVWYSISSLAPASGVRAVAPRPITSAPAPAETVPSLKPEIVLGTQVGPAPSPAPPKPPAEQRRTPAPTVAEPAPAAAPALLQASRAAERPRIAPEVSRGYAALRAGDLAAARREYKAALSADSSNLDAALGLATVDAREGNPEAAAKLYRRALEIDPRNPTALAGLASLSGAPRGEAIEQQLQREISQHPSSAALHFLLGNAYAAQSLWAQAQAAFFEAHRLDPDSPDILYNLAVSLDRIGQPKAAAGFYARALAAARTQAAQFDPAAASRRLGEIDAAK